MSKLFSGKDKKSKINLLCAEFAQMLWEQGRLSSVHIFTHYGQGFHCSSVYITVLKILSEHNKGASQTVNNAQTDLGFPCLNITSEPFLQFLAVDKELSFKKLYFSYFSRKR